MSNRIIAISREFGSGGRTVGKRLAETLGIPCYDAELIDEIAQESGLSREFITERSEDAGGGWLSHALAGRDLNGLSCQDELWLAQRKVIRQLAEKGPCVIVGRCADFILREREDCLRVFIHADMDSRARRIVEQYGERSDSPQKRLKDKDKRRATYYQFYTEMKWGDVRHYHIALDSGKLGIDTCVEILAALCR